MHEHQGKSRWYNVKQDRRTLAPEQDRAEATDIEKAEVDSVRIAREIVAMYTAPSPHQCPTGATSTHFALAFCLQLYSPVSTTPSSTPGPTPPPATRTTTTEGETTEIGKVTPTTLSTTAEDSTDKSHATSKAMTQVTSYTATTTIVTGISEQPSSGQF